MRLEAEGLHCHTPSLQTAAARRGDMPKGTRTAFCRVLVEHSADEQLRMLGDCRVPPACGEPLPAFFNCWMDHALDTAGEFQLRLCALAVARLLCSKHPTLKSIKARFTRGR